MTTREVEERIVGSYRFITRFVLACPPSAVFAAVLEPEDWLPQLPQMRSLERTSDGDAYGVGRSYTTVVGTALYRLRWRMTTVSVEPESRLSWVASGDLDGVASWVIAAVSPGTLVTSSWQVHTTRWWMRALTPVGRPLVVRNHDKVMRAGAGRLADHLDAPLLSIATEWARAGRSWRAV